tara:strand:+ start:1132 stop:2421 length:1290 start_codon:yes stop_codon:yes gene_type:complete
MKIIKLNALVFILMRCSSPIDTITILEPVHNNNDNIVRTGLEVLIEDHPNYIKGKSIGLITNYPAVGSSKDIYTQLFQNNYPFKIKKLFSHDLEYFKGMIEADELISFDSIDIELVSIKDTLLSLSTNLLDGLDIIALDIQDIGSRFNSKLHYVTSLIEIAGEEGVEFLIFDRPNPIGGVIIEGPIPSINMETSEKIFPIPTRHGLTIGEIAHLAYLNKWFSISPTMTIVKMNKWRRNMFYDDTGLSWVPLEKNIPDLETAIIYPGMCIYESSNISLGFGTKKPYKQVGAPWMEFNIAKEMKLLNINDVDIKYAKFIPNKIQGHADKPIYDKEKCFGKKVIIKNKETFRSIDFGINSFYISFALNTENIRLDKKMFNDLFGSKDLLKLVTGKLKDEKGDLIRVPNGLIKKLQDDINVFSEKIAPFYLYN